MVIDIAPPMLVAIRAARTCSCCITCSSRITPTYMSCAIADADRLDVDGAAIYRRAHAEEDRQDVEAADDRHRPDHAVARVLRSRYGEETHQDVRHSGGSEHERHAERDLVDRRLEQQP